MAVERAGGRRAAAAGPWRRRTSGITDDAPIDTFFYGLYWMKSCWPGRHGAQRPKQATIG